jgi:serine/threonine-protein kinase
MELVDGPTLADRIAQGPLPLDEALPVARQIAEALEAAHAQGHRPSRSQARERETANGRHREGARLRSRQARGRRLANELHVAGMSLLPDVASPVVTQSGVILGTVAYMSPEQARGKPVDERTDIWAFGCVLYEMLTGRRPFEGGDSTSDEIAAILTREPVWTAVPHEYPESVRRLLRRCLQKDNTRRLRDAGDAKLEIDEADAEPVARRARGSRGRGRALVAVGCSRAGRRGGDGRRRVRVVAPRNRRDRAAGRDPPRADAAARRRAVRLHVANRRVIARRPQPRVRRNRHWGTAALHPPARPHST